MPKSLEYSRLERDAMQREYAKRVEAFQLDLENPPLSDKFVLSQLRQIQGKEVARGYVLSELTAKKIVLLNQFGYIDILVWVTNHKAKTVFVSTELYSRGISGDTSGHGSDALQALTALRQNLASQSEYTIITLTSLNAGSAPLHERVGRPLTQLMKADLVRFRTLVPDDQWLAWKELLASLTHNASYYRVDTPQSEFIPSSQFDMDIVPIIADFLELNQVDRTTPSLHDGQPSTSSSLFGKILHNLFR